jgi:HAD superfamily phosphatase
MTMRGVLIFDMDGVLVDVRDSYRQTVIETVKHFTGAAATNHEIQKLKNRGGANNDWNLALEMVRERGGIATREEVIHVFQRISYGENNDGLISRERWLAEAQLLEGLARRWRLALFTGRMRWEAEHTLRRFSPQTVFDPMICMEDVAREKPDPDGLISIMQATDPREAYYIGDTVDDCAAAQGAGVPFIGVAGAGIPLREELVERFRQAGAYAFVSDINELEHTLP